ncbi:MAG: valine--tRNA ligase [Mycoplasmoidaceae bacterium]
MERTYKPQTYEKGIFELWIKAKLFDKKHNKKPLYTIVLPPPNITGKLHIGHAWDVAIQDTMIRYKKLQGFNTRWIAGMDHAGIATQTKFEKHLRDLKINKENYSRSEFFNEIKKWSFENASRIREQWFKMGLALDYQHENFTLSEANSKYINDVFIKLYKKKLIYRAFKLVNWDVKLQTAISNIEVISKEVENNLYYINYQVVGSNKKLLIATTRPETMFADTCLVVNPKDSRFKKLIGSYAINPANNQKIEIIADPYVDMKYGTGIMKCTPAHDFNDYKIGIKYKQDFVSCMNYDGTMNHLANEFSGIDRLKCRTLLIEKFEAAKIIKKVEVTTSNLNYSERSGAIVEPLLSLQWFMKMEEVAKTIIQNQKSKNKVHFFPKKFESNLLTWLNNIEDWCISRQLIWGHRIPAWFNEKNEIHVGIKKPSHDKWTQDEDVFDTWFSSGLWPILAVNNSLTNSSFQPSNLLVTGYDIIFFWVARMMIFTELLKKDIPFHDVFIHGLIRDAQGRKMSKSLNNGIDPMDVIDQYGVDALRLFFISSSSIGEDLIYSEEKIISMSKFLNKFWNIANFIDLKITRTKLNEFAKPDYFDFWIINKFNLLLKEFEKDFEKYNFVVATSKLLKFIKNDFSGIYLEMNKWKLVDQNNYFEYLVYDMFKKILIIFEPICPFITDKIYLELYDDQSILEDNWPLKYQTKKENVIHHILAIVESSRRYKWENKLSKKDQLKISFYCDDQFFKIFNKHQEYIGNILLIENIKLINLNIRNKSLKLKNHFEILEFGTIEFLYEIKEDSKIDEGLIRKKINDVLFEINRSEKMLANKAFITKAPKKLVDDEKMKLIDNKKILKELEYQLKK